MIGYLVLHKRKIISWGLSIEDKIPNILTDQLPFAINGCSWLKVFTDNEPTIEMKLEDDLELYSVKKFKVSNIDELSKYAQEYRVHPKFRGFDIKSKTFITNKNVKKFWKKKTSNE